MKAKINFRPGKALASALTSLNFTQVDVKYPKQDSEESEEEEDLPEDEV